MIVSRKKQLLNYYDAGTTPRKQRVVKLNTEGDKMIAYDLYWKSNDDWWEFDKNFDYVIKEDAPKEAKQSYENYVRLNKEIALRKAKGKELVG